MSTMTAAKITDTYGREHALPGPFRTITEMKVANADAGRYFFTRDTMRFFRSRIVPGVIAGRIFITSEQFDDSSPRLYTVRVMGDDGDTADVSTFQQFATLDEARKYARSLTA